MTTIPITSSTSSGVAHVGLDEPMPDVREQLFKSMFDEQRKRGVTIPASFELGIVELARLMTCNSVEEDGFPYCVTLIREDGTSIDYVRNVDGWDDLYRAQLKAKLA